MVIRTRTRESAAFACLGGQKSLPDPSATSLHPARGPLTQLLPGLPSFTTPELPRVEMMIASLSSRGLG